jgi:DNA polymerase delta subunit 1
MALEFQIYDYVEDHDVDDIHSEDEYKPIGDYIINVFGRTIDCKSVYAKITGFTPYFYIALPHEWSLDSKSEIKRKIEIIKIWLKSKENTKVWFRFKSTLLDIIYVKRKKTDIGFTFDIKTQEEKKYNFAKLIFNNSDGMKKFANFFDFNEIMIPTITNKPTRFKIYESNIAPMLKCFHIKKISGCSWVKSDNYKRIKSDKKESYCDIEINLDWNNLFPIQKDSNAPLIIASFDIECYSHDGQFPQAYRKKDQIIQIGITYTKLGENNPFRKWIACLNKTDPVEGVNVKQNLN